MTIMRLPVLKIMPSLVNRFTTVFSHTHPTGFLAFKLSFRGCYSMKIRIIYLSTATSDGKESHLNSTSGGHCNDSVNKIYMKIEVYVCDNQGNGKRV